MSEQSVEIFTKLVVHHISHQSVYRHTHTHTHEHYRVGQKKWTPNALHNFAKYWPIFEMLSPLQSLENLQFNNCCIANFLEIVTVKAFRKSASIWRSCEEHLGFTFLAHPVDMNQQTNTTNGSQYAEVITTLIFLLHIVGLHKLILSRHVYENF